MGGPHTGTGHTGTAGGTMIAETCGGGGGKSGVGTPQRAAGRNSGRQIGTWTQVWRGKDLIASTLDDPRTVKRSTVATHMRRIRRIIPLILSFQLNRHIRLLNYAFDFNIGF